jgi:xylose dehydrogenase (NAD/NADP)
MANRVLRWGLISTARINRAVIPPLKESPRNELAAVASRARDKAEAYAQEWGIPQAFDSYEAMLINPDIDVVYNPLPNHLHAEWTIRAAEAGKHILCEKPLALTVDEVEAIALAARQAGVVVAEAFMYRHHPQTLKVKEIVDSGVLGTIRVIRGAFTFNIGRPDDVRLNPAMGGGSVWDVGCYPISYARMLLGEEPVEVFGQQMTGASGVDEYFVGQLRFANDVFAQFDCGFRAPYRSSIEVVGSERTLRVANPFKPGVKEQLLLDSGGEVETIAVDGRELYIGEIEDMADAILEGKRPRVSLADSRANTAAIVALLQSAQEGRPVGLEG